MRWVKETFPPRDRARWLLMTMRLSASSLAGTARTLVAVGTVSERFMFLTTAADAPRSGDWAPAAIGVAGVLAAAAGLSAGLSAGLAAGVFTGAACAGAESAAGFGAASGACAEGAAATGCCFGATTPLDAVVASARSAAPTGLPGR